MSNSNYAQVTDLLAEGKLHWTTDSISAYLLTGAVFDAGNTLLTDVGAPISSMRIPGRVLLTGGNAMGMPAYFSNAVPDIEYQVIVCQDIGPGQSLPLAFIDENHDGDPITVQREGTLIVRPSQENVTPEGELPPTVGLWMVL